MEARRASNGLVKIVSGKTADLGWYCLEFKAEHVSTAAPHVRCGIKLPHPSLNVERFAKAHERAAHIPRWRAAQAFMARLKGLQLPVFDLHVDHFLASGGW